MQARLQAQWNLSVEFNVGSLNLNQWEMERGGGVVR